MIELPSPRPVVVTEHELVARTCPGCGHRVTAAPPGLEVGRIGRCRFGPRLLTAVALMATIERLPQHLIQQRLARDYGLRLSEGGVVGLLQRVAERAQPVMETLQAEARASPVVHMDETGWRENGCNGYLWLVHTPTLALLTRDPHRSMDVADRLVGEDFAGTLVTDFYAAYDHLPGPHQRCWSHLWRDLDALERQCPQDREVQAWIAGIGSLYRAATAARPAREEGDSPEAVQARHRRACRYERRLLALCPEDLAPDKPHATLVHRLRRYQNELFTFVRDPRVPPTNNAAERALRSIVVSRKISGGTRSAAGSTTRMTLYSVCATAQLRGLDPAAALEHVLLTRTLPTPPPDSPSI
jgi:hypothetical protein